MVLRLRKKKVDGRRELQAILGEHEIPTFPGVVMRAIETMRRPDSSAAEVATVLRTDPGLTVRLLKLVNSAAYSPARPVNNVDQAVAVAGYATVESLVLSVGVTAVLPDQQIDGFDQLRFWRTASLRAALARRLAMDHHPATAGLSFTAGLLQDMAIPLLAAVSADYAPLLVAWHEGEADLVDLEQDRFGWSHDQVARWLCDEWELPESLAVAIGGHHGRGDEPAPPAIELVSHIRDIELDDVAAVVGPHAGTFGYDLAAVHEAIEAAEVEAADLARIFA